MDYNRTSLRNSLFLILLLTALSFYPVFSRAEVDESIYQKVELYQNVIDKVSTRYVTDLDPGELIIRSIEGMIETLDPYSQLLDPDDFDDLKIDTRGRFGGIGIEIGLRNDILTVIAPIEGTPAHALGLQGGDKIVKIEGETTQDWSILDAVKKLRGPKGTDVTITIERQGLKEPFDLTITRDIIKVKSVPYFFMIDDKTGYIRLSTFSESSGEEVRDAVKELMSQEMESLILDLRFNPGGLLSQAVEVAEVFMEKGEMIVYTDGRFEGQDREYLASKKGLTDKMPIVTLINSYSASASEIVAGALQDHDRALILGEPSFGKGSVQTLFELGGDYALRLTTAYYYTPSGRSIHRTNGGGDEVLVIEEHAPQGNSHTGQADYFTDSGRKVAGGGGIVPDIKLEPDLLSDVAQRIVQKPVFFNYVVDFKSKKPDLPQDFRVTEELLNDFFEYLVGQEIEISEEEYDSEKGFVEMRLEFEIDRQYWGEGVAKKKGLDKDTGVQKALEVINQGKTLAGLFDVAMRSQEGQKE